MDKKAIKIGSDHVRAYYIFPDEYKNMDDFIKHLTDKPNSFVRLTKLSEKTCFPYFIEEESREVYLRLNQSAEIQPVSVTLLTKEEYTARLIKLVDTVCVGCGSYIDDKELLGEIGNLRGHWRQMNLDGHCDSFWRKSENDCE